MKEGKKIAAARQKVDKTRQYDIAEAVAILKEAHFVKFDESVDLDVRLGVDNRAADQQVRGSVVLPHGTGKTVRIAVFAQGEQEAEARAAGADVVGGNDLVKKVQEGFLDFDKAIATPDMMREVGKLGKILGPRNMMPNPKAGTVTTNIAQAIKEQKAGKVEYKLDRFSIIHLSLGKISFGQAQLEENVHSVMDAIIKARPAAAKGNYIKSATLSTTMGPGVPLRSAV